MYNVNFHHTADNTATGSIIEQFTDKSKARKYMANMVKGYRTLKVIWDGKDRVVMQFKTYAIALWIDKEPK